MPDSLGPASAPVKRAWWKIPADLAARTDVSPAAKLVYAAISDHIGNNGSCWPGVRCLAIDCGLSRSRAHEAVEELARLDMIRVDRGGGTRTNRYSTKPAPGLFPPADAVSGRADTGQRAVSGRADAVSGRADTTCPAERTEPDKVTRSNNQTKKARARSDDPWDLAQLAMRTSTLRTEAFKAAWGEWLEYRRQARKRLTAATIERQIHALEKFGHDAALASIARSIQAGWTGLFDRDHDRPNRPLSRVDAPPGKYAHLGRQGALGGPAAGAPAANPARDAAGQNPHS